jgi:hypothetical protein
MPNGRSHEVVRPWPWLNGHVTMRDTFPRGPVDQSIGLQMPEPVAQRRVRDAIGVAPMSKAPTVSGVAQIRTVEGLAICFAGQANL